MMGNDLVSILIPVYNRKHIVGETIESAINQTYEHIEIIISDNCSTDGTWEVLLKYAEIDNRIKLFRNDENIGPVRNWKKCLDQATGKYVKILWSDDWMNHDFIEKALLLFDDETAFVLSGYSITDGIKSKNSTFKKEYKTDYYLKHICTHNRLQFPVSPGAAIFRKSDVDKYLYIKSVPNNDNLDSLKNGAGNDLLLFLFVANNYKKISCTPGVDNFFRIHSSSFSVSDDNIYLYYYWAILYYIIKSTDYHLENIFKMNLWFTIQRDKTKFLKSVFIASDYRINSIRNVLEFSTFAITKIAFSFLNIINKL
ncbi:MAG: putative biosynthesis related glycosyltransferase [Bacteroidetes bacterium]|nr:putative biosynthesis related glycosyltransferase [Bacteroidota bacterium]